MRCKICGKEWSLEGVLSYQPSNWNFQEVMAERVCALCHQGQDGIITGIIHGGFYIKPWTTWKDVLTGNMSIEKCPDCEKSGQERT